MDALPLSLPFQRTIGLLIFVPMVIPEVLMGVSLLTEFVHLLKMPLGYTTHHRPYDVLFSLRAGRGTGAATWP